MRSAIRWSKRVPAADRRSSGRGGRTASTAANRGSGLITIPAPPPNGVSSTLRCGSVVCSRGSWTRTSTRPRSRARPRSDEPRGPSRYAGKIVNTSTRMRPESYDERLRSRSPSGRSTTRTPASCSTTNTNGTSAPSSRTRRSCGRPTRPSSRSAAANSRLLHDVDVGLDALGGAGGADDLPERLDDPAALADETPHVARAGVHEELHVVAPLLDVDLDRLGLLGDVVGHVLHDRASACAEDPVAFGRDLVVVLVFVVELVVEYLVPLVDRVVPHRPTPWPRL